MTNYSVHVTRLLAANEHGPLLNAQVFAHSLDRLSQPSTQQLELLQSLQMLEKLREETHNLLDLCEQRGLSALSALCRKVMHHANCEFSLVHRWGVCAWTGHTVNEFLCVSVNTAEVCIDSRFGAFVQSLWNMSHLEVIESLRMEESEPTEGITVCAEEVALCYLTSFAHVKSTLGLTLAKLHDLSLVEESQNSEH